MNLRLSKLLAVALVACATVAIGPSAARARSLPYLSFFPRGECTRWAYVRRPDIVNVAVSRYGIYHWTAWRWVGNARRAGFFVSRHPHRDDIAVWGRGVAGAWTSTGHVAYVERVNADGTIRVTELNWDGHQTPTPRTVPARDVAQLQFIHHRRR